MHSILHFALGASFAVGVGIAFWFNSCSIRTMAKRRRDAASFQPNDPLPQGGWRATLSADGVVLSASVPWMIGRKAEDLATGTPKRQPMVILQRRAASGGGFQYIDAVGPGKTTLTRYAAASIPGTGGTTIIRAIPA
jgi:hypothetical protein